MRSKIYEKNDFKKYYNKNEEFNEPFIPDYIRNSINNTIVPKKSFCNKENQKKNSNFSPNNFNYSNNNYETSYPTNNFTFNDQANQSESKFYDSHHNEWNNRPAAYSHTHATNDFNNPNTHFFGFSKFLEKKNVYDRLADLRDSIGKRKINSPYLVLSSHEDDKKEFYDNITTTSPKEYFLHSPRKIKSLLSINCRESLKNAHKNNDEFFTSKKGDRSFSSSTTLFHTEASKNKTNEDLNLNFIDRLNSHKNDDFGHTSKNNFSKGLRSPTRLGKTNEKFENEMNRSSTSINLKDEKNRSQLGLKVQQPSKVNILYKIEQYKDYLRFKGV